MKKELIDHLSTANFLEDQGLKYGFLLSLFRYVLQSAAYSAYEACAASVDCPEGFDENAQKLLQPSDGDFPSTLDLCIPLLRTVWPNCTQAWFDARGSQYKESGKEIAASVISQRNDRMGHGVFDEATLHSQLEILPSQIESLIEILSDLIPNFAGLSPSETAQLQMPSQSIKVEMIRRHQGQLVLVRKIENRGSVWRIRGQTLSHQKSTALLIEVSDKCGLLGEIKAKQTGLISRVVSTGDDFWRASVLLPLRQTQSFEGRIEEIASLHDWWSDLDSRACLIYGEGGIGKTTLVLEFLNDLLDSPPENLNWQPVLIFFYSAKLTRWGVSGLEQLSGVNANINEALRNLARILEPRLGIEWQSEDSRSLISRTADLFKTAGLTRDSILIVLDNTETLARSAAEEAGLGKVLREVSTKVGKLLITSRRREAFEAMQIPVPPMLETTGASLLKKLADDYHAEAIQKAGDSRCRKITRQFGGKPILLDVLARHIANTGCGIDEGISAILSQERGDLGAFLFEDAWKRMDKAFCDVFLVLGQLGGAISEQILTWTCAEFTCYAPNWLSAFEETRFGSLVDYGAHFDITLDSGAREFLAAKYSALPGEERHRISSVVGRVRKKHLQATAAAEERITDRVLAAFRTTAAKAAKLAASRRDVDEAIKWYEEATLVDSTNPALFDRYAWYLMVNDRLEKAALVAKVAVRLDPNDADSNFTAGMIAARRGQVDEADAFLGASQKHGKQNHLVKLQKSRARLERAVIYEESGSPQRRELLLEAIKMLDSAESPEKGNSMKHETERGKLFTRCHSLLEGTRPSRHAIQRGKSF